MDCLERQFLHEQDLKTARLEIVMGFLKTIDKLDAVIKVIRAAKTPKEAVIELVSNRALKFTADQARAILEMRLRQLTNLDTDELVAENSSLNERLTELSVLIENKDARAVHCFNQLDELGKRYGEAPRSLLVSPPASPVGTPARSGEKRAPAAPKPRFMKVDLKKGVVEQAKGPRGAMVVDAKEKVIFMTNDGILKKVPATFKGTLGTGYSEVVLAKRETDVSQRNYLLVFSLDGQLKAMTLRGEDLCKTTSKGKWFLPDMAHLIHFGETSYVVPWTSTRKKKVELFPIKVKQGRPGGKGVKVADLVEVKL